MKRRKALRWAKLTGSEKHKIIVALRRGWEPGLDPADFLPRGRQGAAGK